MTHCPRCGKDNPAEIHTCTPLGLVLAEYLDLPHIGQHKSAAELRRLHAENEAKDALLRQALECLERSDTLGWQANLPVIQAIKERLNG